ncbi:30S ribosomal protein S21, partial [Gemmatimonadota bacterium]
PTPAKTRAVEDVVRVAYVQVRDNESFEKTLKRFQKQVKKEGITTDLKRKRYHLKPSERKHQRKLSQKRKQRRRATNDRV